MSNPFERLATVLLGAVRREEGQDMVEYALVTVVLSVALVTFVVTAGLPGAFEDWADYIATAIPG